MRTILKHFDGSPWANHNDVQDVVAEYGHFIEAGRTPTQTRRVSLQIFHASRAIDSLLAHIVRHESAKPGRQAAPPNPPLGTSQVYIRENRIGGVKFTPATDSELDDVRNARNTYLHRANRFPSDQQVRIFLDKTSRIIDAALRFLP